MSFLGVALGLAAAACWGGGDYAGGRAARRLDPFGVLALSTVAGVGLLLALAAASGESIPAASAIRLAIVAGAFGTLGLAALYRALATGRAAVVAPVAAVLTAALPVVYTALVEGLPTPLQGAGLVVGLCGIWLVSAAGRTGAGNRRDLSLAAAAGVFFGLLLILIARASTDSHVAPLVVSRATTLVMAVALASARRIAWAAPRAHPAAVLAGLLDASAAALYVAAGQQIRLDLAAVLSSLYPVTTVLLARALDRDPVTRRQWLGAAVCLAAVVLIAL